MDKEQTFNTLTFISSALKIRWKTCKHLLCNTFNGSSDMKINAQSNHYWIAVLWSILLSVILELMPVYVFSWYFCWRACENLVCEFCYCRRCSEIYPDSKRIFHSPTPSDKKYCRYSHRQLLWIIRPYKKNRERNNFSQWIQFYSYEILKC